MKILLAFLFLISLSGCATQGKLEEKLQDNVGENINDIIDEAGPPTNVFHKPNGEIVYTWHYNGDTIASGSSSQAVVTTTYCNISYVTKPDGTIRNWAHQGNICRMF
jgi:hypothetical protein